MGEIRHVMRPGLQPLAEAEFWRLLTAADGQQPSDRWDGWARIDDQAGWGRLRHVRNVVAVVLWGEVGLRVSESVALRWADVCTGDRVGEWCRVRAEVAKRGSGGMVPLTRVARSALVRWAAVVRSAGAWSRDREVLAGLGGWGSLTVRAWQSWLRRLSIRVLGRPVSPHALRHCLGMRLREAGDLEVARVWLRHRSLRSTQWYLGVGLADLRRVAQRLE